jgi:urease accessory protein
LRLGDRLARIADEAMDMTDERLANFAPGLAIASSRHETQYSRLFRS